MNTVSHSGQVEDESLASCVTSRMTDTETDPMAKLTCSETVINEISPSVSVASALCSTVADPMAKLTCSETVIKEISPNVSVVSAICSTVADFRVHSSRKQYPRTWGGPSFSSLGLNFGSWSNSDGNSSVNRMSMEPSHGSSSYSENSSSVNALPSSGTKHVQYFWQESETPEYSVSADNVIVLTETSQNKMKFCVKCGKGIDTVPALNKCVDFTGAVVYKKLTYKCTTCKVRFADFVPACNPRMLSPKIFSCDECSGKFSSIRDLNRHYRGHVQYECTMGCTDTFFTGMKLKSHYALYHKGPPLTCDTCKKTFKNKAQLREHVQSHMQSKDRDIIKCPYKNCQRKYFHKRNLTQHMLYAHAGQGFQCKECQQYLSTKQKLLEHMNAIHKKQRNLIRKKRIIVTRPTSVHKLLGIREFKVTGDGSKKKKRSNQTQPVVKESSASRNDINVKKQRISRKSFDLSLPSASVKDVITLTNSNQKESVVVENLPHTTEFTKALPDRFISIVYE